MTLYIHHLVTKAWIAEVGGHIHRYLLTSDPGGKNIATTFVHSDGRCQESLDTVDTWARSVGITIGNRETWSLPREETP